MVRIADLYALQEIDSAFDAATRRLAEARERLEQGEGLDTERRRLDEIESELREAERAQRAAEADVADERAKVEEEETKLYSGEIRGTRELQDMQREVESLRRQLAAREEVALAALGQADELRAEQRALSERIQEGETAWALEQERLTDEVQQLDAQLASLQTRRTAAVRPIDAPTLALYDRLRRTKGGTAVARVQRGACLGCHITLPTTIFQKARSGQRVAQCSSCERILYVG